MVRRMVAAVFQTFASDAPQICFVFVSPGWNPGLFMLNPFRVLVFISIF